MGLGVISKWPPRAPDLAPLDFFMRGRLSQSSTAKQLKNIKVLKQEIREYSKICTNILRQIQVSYVCLIQKCFNFGQKFRHLLWFFVVLKSPRGSTSWPACMYLQPELLVICFPNYMT